MTFQEHCQESIRVFGKAYEDVHRYLDHYMGQPGIGMRQRRFHHHQAGIQEGWDPDRDPFPKDQDHLIQIGFYG